MTKLYLVLLALAAICFLASTLGRTVAFRDRTLNVASLGLLLWVLVPLIEIVRSLD